MTTPSHMLTTVDNPFNPHTQFDEWYAWDERHGYHTLSFLARIVKTSDDLSAADQDFAIEQGIDEIVEMNVLGIYKKVAEPTSDDTSTAA
jgi:hypothetical protein